MILLAYLTTTYDVLDVLECALRATLGTLWFIAGLATVMFIASGRLHL